VGLPPWFRLLLRVSVVALFALGPATTLCAWLTIGTITEAWPWLLWGEGYLALAERTLGVGRPVVYLSLLVVAFWGLGFLTEPRRRTKRTWSRRLLLLAPRTVYGGLVLVCLAVLVPLTAVNTVRLVRTWPPRTNQVLLGNILGQLEAYDLAIVVFEAALALEPEHLEAAAGLKAAKSGIKARASP